MWANFALITWQGAKTTPEHPPPIIVSLENMQPWMEPLQF